MDSFIPCANDSNAAPPAVLLAAPRAAATGLLFRAALNCSARGGRVYFITKRLARYPCLPSSVVHDRGCDSAAPAGSSAAAGAAGEASDDELERIEMKYVDSHAELIYLLSHAHELTASYRMVVLNGISSFFAPPLDSATTRAALLRAVALAMSVARHFGARADVGGACRLLASEFAPSASAAAGASGGGATGAANPNTSMLERVFAVVLVAHEEPRQRGGRGGGRTGGGPAAPSSADGSLVLRVRPRGRLAGGECGTLVCRFGAAAAAT